MAPAHCTPERLLAALQADEAPEGLTSRLVATYRDALDHLDQTWISELQHAIYLELVSAGHSYAALAILSRQDVSVDFDLFPFTSKENKHRGDNPQ